MLLILDRRSSQSIAATATRGIFHTAASRTRATNRLYCTRETGREATLRHLITVNEEQRLHTTDSECARVVCSCLFLPHSGDRSDCCPSKHRHRREADVSATPQEHKHERHNKREQCSQQREYARARIRTSASSSNNSSSSSSTVSARSADSRAASCTALILSPVVVSSKLSAEFGRGRNSLHASLFPLSHLNPSGGLP